MGWNAAGLFAELIWVTQKNVPDEDSRKEIYDHMWDSFVELDWDNQDECLGVDDVFDEIYKERHPEADKEAYEDDE